MDGKKERIKSLNAKVYKVFLLINIIQIAGAYTIHSFEVGKPGLRSETPLDTIFLKSPTTHIFKYFGMHLKVNQS